MLSRQRHTQEADLSSAKFDRVYYDLGILRKIRSAQNEEYGPDFRSGWGSAERTVSGSYLPVEIGTARRFSY
jgi:hypothetical protein